MKTYLYRGEYPWFGVYRADLEEPCIQLFVDTMIRWARYWKCSYQDLKLLVQYHEEAHNLQHISGFEFSEEAANTIALRRFIREQGRKPSVPMSEWMKTSMKKEEVHA